MSKPAFTVVSTFAGCGGSSLGYEMAGGQILLAVEWDANAVATYKLNHQNTNVYHGDIAQLSVEQMLSLVSCSPGELDILDGSPPCQGFSTAGKRKVDDPRNSLFKEYVRLLRGLSPRAFVMENVSGMVKGRMKAMFAIILAELKSCGYRVRARLLNAAWYGVPQSRERIIFIGAREDLGIDPTHPSSTVARAVTLRTACDGVDSIGPMLTGRLAGTAFFMKPWQLAGSAFEALGKKRKSFATRRLAWDRPSATVTKTCGTGLGGLIHPEAAALMSIAALKRIGSFPDSYQFIGSFQEQWARIGNSVPPLLMAAIARHVRDTIVAPSAGHAA